MHPEPLQTGQNRGQFVAARERQANLFDGRDLEIGLGLKSVAHGVWLGRMLQLQTAKPPQTFNHHPNIRPTTSAANPRQAQSGRVQGRALTTHFGLAGGGKDCAVLGAAGGTGVNGGAYAWLRRRRPRISTPAKNQRLEGKCSSRVGSRNSRPTAEVSSSPSKGSSRTQSAPASSSRGS